MMAKHIITSVMILALVSCTSKPSAPTQTSPGPLNQASSSATTAETISGTADAKQNQPQQNITRTSPATQQTNTERQTIQAVPKTNLKSDQHVLLFPTNAVFNAESGQWNLNIHGWVYEPEADSIWRNALTKSLAFIIDAKRGTPDGERFERRSAMFLVDNKRGRVIVLKAAEQYFSSPATGANGHFEFNAAMAPGKSQCQDWLRVKINTHPGYTRMLGGQIQCLPNEGISVISDIDDTIKDSNVLDKKKLMKKTFLKEFQAVKGMSELYRHWQSKGYRFHYVSSSPWQLYPALNKFISKQSFPSGSMHLKLIRVKDSSLFNLFASPEEGKLPTITKLLTTYPKRRFILVGDSGERDANIYADIARRYPERIVKIYIRDVRGGIPAVETIFAGLPKTQWTVFSSPTELLSNLARLKP